jgi:hypothetical protein
MLLVEEAYNQNCLWYWKPSFKIAWVISVGSLGYGETKITPFSKLEERFYNGTVIIDVVTKKISL